MRKHNSPFRKIVFPLAAAVVMVALPAGAALAGTAPSASAAAAPACTSVTGPAQAGAQVASAQSWTPQEMRAALPLSQASVAKVLARMTPAQREAVRRQASPDARATVQPVCSGAVPITVTADAATPAGAASRSPVPAVAAPQTKSLTSGYRTIGKFFFRVPLLMNAPFNCTATAINDAKNNAARALVLTAAHCFLGDYDGVIFSTDDWAFAPGWHNNKSPYGMWQVKAAYYPSQWYQCGLVLCSLHGPYDFAVFIVKPMHGHGVGWYVGEDGWHVNMPRTKPVTIFGVPGNSSRMLENAATSVTVTTNGYLDRRASTPGFGDGASGGPWFYSYSFKTQLGDILGDTGGYDAGGPTNSPSYSPWWNGAFSGFVANVAKKE